MMLVRDVRPKIQRTTLLRSFRVQALILLGASVVLPALFWKFTGPRLPRNIAVQHAAIGAVFAVLFGLFAFRRVTSYPGTRFFAFILPSYAVSYGIVVVFLFLFRLEYSSTYLVESFFIALIVSFTLGSWVDQRNILRFHVVKFGSADFVYAIPGVEWIIMDRPEVPEPAGAPLVADLRFDHPPEWERMLAEAAVRGHPVYHIKQLRESLTGQVTMEHLSENSFGSLLPNLAYRKVKRLFDLVMCVGSLPLTIAVMALVALAIKVDSPGPVFFMQERMGYRGVSFRMIKFRTMTHRTEKADPAMAVHQAMTQTDDLRITRIGRLLRRTRLDEIPQILNVLTGEMSLIGPRPEAAALSQWYEAEIPFYFYRHIVRPGISGWAQVHQGHVTDLNAAHVKLTYDFYYIKNFSAWLDILIVFRTLAVMVSGFGSK